MLALAAALAVLLVFAGVVEATEPFAVHPADHPEDHFHPNWQNPSSLEAALIALPGAWNVGLLRHARQSRPATASLYLAAQVDATVVLRI